MSGKNKVVGATKKLMLQIEAHMSLDDALEQTLEMMRERGDAKVRGARIEGQAIVFEIDYTVDVSDVQSSLLGDLDLDCAVSLDAVSIGVN